MESRRPATTNTLSAGEKALVRALAFADVDFEPFPAFLAGASRLDGLIALGLAEVGPSIRPAVSATGYRLTDEGWRIYSALNPVTLSPRPFLLAHPPETRLPA